MMNFNGKVVLITGGSDGIGAACVRRFSAMGALVSNVDKKAGDHGSTLLTEGDISNRAVRARAVNTTLDRLGRIDILINNVGVGMYQPPSVSPEDGDRLLFETNVFSAIGMAQLIIPHMRATGGGYIANISSVGAYSGLPWAAAYCASKAALHSYSESLRRELRGTGIHVSTIVPGIVNTRFRQHVIGGAAPQAVTEIRAVVSPDTVAASVVRSIARRKRRVFVPWYGAVFAAADLLLPCVVDAYMARKWTAPENQSRAPAAEAMKTYVTHR